VLYYYVNPEDIRSEKVGKKSNYIRYLFPSVTGIKVWTIYFGRFSEKKSFKLVVFYSDVMTIRIGH